ncbi:hypothetical protein FHG87_023221 [Trinorchestia longiramus]|nr:hypothetical protein FHG87_023221 [Trinorchestia longiramus]
MTCILWVDMELCKGLSGVNDSNLRKFVFDCWKCMADGKHELGSSFLKVDGSIQPGCFLGDRLHLSQKVETKLSPRYICWIKATRLLMKPRIE